MILPPLVFPDLSDASFLGKLLVFPANVRLDWKVITSTNTLAYLASSTVTKGKCFKTLTPGVRQCRRQRGAGAGDDHDQFDCLRWSVD